MTYLIGNYVCRNADKALKEHQRLSRLFRENRFAFELEKRQKLEAAVQSAGNQELRAILTDMQKKWDHVLQHAASAHNRLVLAQMLFWNHVNNDFRPALNRLTVL